MVLSEQLLPSSYHAGSVSEWLFFKAKENKSNQYNLNTPVLIVMLQWRSSIIVRQCFSHQKNETWFPSFPGSSVSTCGFSEQALPAVTLLPRFQVSQRRNQNTQFQNTPYIYWAPQELLWCTVKLISRYISQTQDLTKTCKNCFLAWYHSQQIIHSWQI